MAVDSLKETQIPNGILDNDTDLQYVKSDAGNYVDLVNARNSISKAQSFNAVVDDNGNILIPNADLPAGRNKCVASYEDIKNGSIIFFVWNEYNMHGIYRYYLNNSSGNPDGHIETIWKVKYPGFYNDFDNPIPLDFDENISFTNNVNLVDDLLTFSNKKGDPNCINIKRANDTNKFYEFDFYCKKTLDAGGTTFNFELYKEGFFLAQTTFSITTVKLTYEEAIKDIFDQLQFVNLTAYLHTEFLGDHLKFTCVNPGRHYLQVTSPNGSVFAIFPGNFYPDFTNSNPFSYPPLPAYMFHRIKHPPFKAPVVAYENTTGQEDVVQISVDSIIQNTPWICRYTGFVIGFPSGPEIIGISPSLSSVPYGAFVFVPSIGEPFALIDALSTPTQLVLFTLLGPWGPSLFTTVPFDISADNNIAVQSQAYFIGFNSEINDVNNWVTLGVNQPPMPKNLFLLGGAPAGYISVPQLTNAFIEVNFKISFNISFDESGAYSPGVTPTQVQIWLVQHDPVGGSNQLVYKLFDKSSSVNQFVVNQKFLYQLDPQYRYQFAVVIENMEYWGDTKSQNLTQIRFDDGIVNINKAPFDLSNIWRGAYQFRSAFRFVDNEYSVMGEVSKLALPEDTLANVINVNFDDKWLRDPSYSALIKEVECYVSPNSGVDWYQFSKSIRKDFAVQADRFVYYEESDQLIAVPPATALLPHHAVPRSADSEALIDNRLMNGGIKEGYDSPLIQVKLSTIFKDISNTNPYLNAELLSNPGFRYGWRGYLGIVYYDNADRRCGVSLISTDQYQIPQIHERIAMTNTIFQAVVPGVRMEIYNDPPPYAVKYRPVITSDLSVTKYLVFFPTSVKKVNVDLTPDAVNTRYWEIDFDSINYYVDKGVIGAKIDWTWAENDRIRIIASAGGYIFPEVYDLRILQVIGSKLYIQYDSSLPFQNILSSPEGLPHWIQIYSISLTPENDNIAFHEIGHTYEIKSVYQNGMIKRYHDSPIQPQSFGPNPLNIVTPAIIEMYEGGTYYRQRYPFSYYGGSTYQQGDEAMIYDESPNDYKEGAQPGFGRDNFILPIGQVYRYSAFKFSDQYISGSSTNELNVVQPANDLQFDVMYGILNTMIVFKNDILKLFFSNGWSASLYINQGVIRQGQENGNIISVSTQVAANSHILERTVSGINPESIMLNDEGDLFGYDDNEGAVYRQSGNGTLIISDIKQKSRFSDISVRRRFLDRAKAFCPAVYDLLHDEYLITVNGASPVQERLPMVDISLMEASVWSKLTLTREPNNLFLISYFNYGTSLIATLKSLLEAFGFTVTFNYDLSMHVVAPNASWSEQSLNLFLEYQLDPESAVQTKIYSFRFSKYQAAGTEQPTVPFTIAFAKTKPGWVERFTFYPEMYGRYKNEFVSFNNGECWLHNRGISKNYYGLQHASQLKIVCNDNFPSAKRFKGLMINANGRYSAPELRILPYEGLPSGMLSEIPINTFQIAEGKQYAAMLRDKLTPGFSTTIEALWNGRPLIGQVITIMIENNSPVQNVLQSIDILYFSSENN